MWRITKTMAASQQQQHLLCKRTKKSAAKQSSCCHSAYSEWSIVGNGCNWFPQWVVKSWCWHVWPKWKVTPKLSICHTNTQTTQTTSSNLCSSSGLKKKCVAANTKTKLNQTSLRWEGGGFRIWGIDPQFQVRQSVIHQWRMFQYVSSSFHQISSSSSS